MLNMDTFKQKTICILLESKKKREKKKEKKS